MPLSSFRRLFTLNTFWLALNISSNTIDPILIPLLIQSFVPDEIKNSALAGVSGAGLIVAMAWQPIIGAVSDRSRRGRWPFLLLGSLGLGLTLPLMIFAPSFIVLLIAILLAQLASNTIQGPLQALITDTLPTQLWGRAAGIKALFEVLGIVLGGYVGGRLIAAGHMPAAYLFIVAALAVAALITSLDLRGVAKPTFSESDETSPAEPAGGLSLFSPALRPYVWWLLNRYLFVIGLTTMRVFGFFFIQDYLRFDNPAQVIGDLIAAIGLVVGLVAFPVGWLGDRIGRRWLMMAAMALATLTMPFLLWVGNTAQLWLVGAGLGIAAATFQSVGWAMAMSLIPTASAGRYLGLANIANAGGSLTARLVIGLLIDTLNRQQTGLGYTAMIVASTVCFALAGLVLTRVLVGKQIDR